MSLDNLMDSKVEALCIKILTTDSEFWEARNKAVLSLTSLIMPYEGAESSRIQEVFNTNIFRLLKDPIKDIISDLRSQQIRDVCLFLIKLSEITRDHMKLLLREIFCFILDAVKVPNRVMSGYVDNAILTMIKNTIFKSCIPSLVSEIRDSKAKMVRERCLEYLNEILIHWDITEKEADVIGDAIRIGLEDAAVRGREIARMAYLNLHLLFPKKTDKIKSNISAPLRQRLIKEEIEKVGPILKAQELAQKKMQNKIPVQGHVNVTANNNNNNGNAGGNRNSSASVTHNNLTPNAAGNASTSSTTSATGDVLTEAEREKLIIISPVKIANLRARRMSCEDSAVASIQALIRGRKSRRQTMSMQMGGDYDVVDDDGDSGALKTAAVIPNTPNRNSSFSEYKDLNFSPSLTSRAPFSGIADNPSKIANCHKDFTIDDENSILGLLKVKTSLMMKFLDEQLSLIEEIEKEGKGNINKKNSAISKNKQKYITTVERILSISSSEIDINKEFQVRLVKLLP